MLFSNFLKLLRLNKVLTGMKKYSILSGAGTQEFRQYLLSGKTKGNELRE